MRKPTVFMHFPDCQRVSDDITNAKTGDLLLVANLSARDVSLSWCGPDGWHLLEFVCRTTGFTPNNTTKQRGGNAKEH